VLAFLAERHLATLTTLRPDGSPHVVPVGFTYDPATRTARVITSGTSAKVRHLRAGGARVAVCQSKDPRAPSPPKLEISVDRILGDP
jgi:nitroimidazol reductase NimA-like FMN-containing flavoprotein (pyridoxamine 5'-phosphate oxidase superfamily)